MKENLKGRIIAQPQGKAIGGSSAINIQALIAPSKTDIDTWESFGNKNWNWASMQPYYRKFFNLTKPSPELVDRFDLQWFNEEVEGKPGPILGTFAAIPEDPSQKAWLETFKNLGYLMTTDPFSGKAIGGFINPSTNDPTTKTRSYAGTAYYAPAMGRTNLHLITGALVESIEMERSAHGMIATGLKYTQGGETKMIKARKEVIVTAGVFQTPKLLELSGIGSPERLQSHGVEVQIENSHVGENLQDHLMTGISFEVQDGVPTGDDLLRGDAATLEAAMKAYQSDQTGPFSTSGITAFGFLPVVDFLSKDGQVTLEDLLSTYGPASGHPAATSHFEHVRSVLEMGQDGAGSYFLFNAQSNAANSLQIQPLSANLQPGNFVTITTGLLHPLSTGSSHIISSDPAQAPKIDPRYFSHPLDVEVHARQVSYLETIAAAQPFASLLKPKAKRNVPSAYVEDLDAAREYQKIGSISNWHGVGTCAMMSKDKGGVVNDRLIVYGTRNLRIADASIIPVIPQSNTQSTVYAVAERAADIIKEDQHG
jgi:choline dehydrogenase-like flavoprotein